MRNHLILTDDTLLIEAFRAGLDPGSRLDRVSAEALVETLEARAYEVLFLDLAALKGMPPEPAAADFKARLTPLFQARPLLEVIVIAAPEQSALAVHAVRGGAAGYLKLPLDPDEVRLLDRALVQDQMLEHELDYLRERFWEADARDVVRTRCANMRKVYDLVRSVAPTRTTVLLTGETGTGKSLLAKLLHRHSNRREAPFISVHCGAIPDTLLESELFGHEKGAFTGAVRRKLGKFEIANGGTIFLDEVGTLTPPAQVKLLMVLQEGLFQRVGGEATLKTDVRVVAATNSDLKQMTVAGLFRKDLFYRLNVFPIELPPLRARRQDIPHLVEGFLARLQGYGTKVIRAVDPRVLQALQQYSWPGNIRELENLIERAYILEATEILTPESLPADIFQAAGAAGPGPTEEARSLHQVRAAGIEEIERLYIRDLLARHAGRINLSAQEAGITTRQLHKLMKKYGLHKEDFKRPA
jgi:DNA-binding NtrC family response regulator